jgi:hypothetical protein
VTIAVEESVHAPCLQCGSSTLMVPVRATGAGERYLFSDGTSELHYDDLYFKPTGGLRCECGALRRDLVFDEGAGVARVRPKKAKR